MATSPDNGVPILFSKIDLKDEYWRICVSKKDAWNFAYILPKEKPDKDVYLIIPDALQIGWYKSPAFFCVATETVRDIAENYNKNNTQLSEYQNKHTIQDIDWNNLPEAKDEPDRNFLTLLEVYIVSNKNKKVFIKTKQIINKKRMIF